MIFKSLKKEYLFESLEPATFSIDNAIKKVSDRITQGKIENNRYWIKEALRQTGAFANDEQLELAVEKILTGSFIPCQAGFNADGSALMLN